MYEFKMSKKITSNIQGLNNLIRIYNKLLKVEDKQITLDFSDTEWISGEMIALFGAITYNLHVDCRKSIFIFGCSKEIEDLFKGNGFSEVIGNMENGKTKEFAVKFKHFKNELQSGNIECFNQYLNDELSPKLELSQKEIAYISTYLSELFINARTHGDTEQIFCCGQKYISINKIRFMIVDLGVGIPSNVRKIIKLSDCECIKWSIEKGNTTKDLGEDFGGLGLATVKDFIDKHNGDLSIISSKVPPCAVKIPLQPEHIA